MAISFDIEVPRQGDWVKELRLTDRSGAPLDLTGHTFQWRARAIAGAGATLAAATVTVLEPTQGIIRARWHGPAFDPYGLPTERVRAAHDLKDIYPDGTVDVPLRGQLIIYPEVTA